MELEPESDTEWLTTDDVAAMKGITPGNVRLAIRQGRLAAIKVNLPPKTTERPCRSVWRIATHNAVAWLSAEPQQPRTRAIVVDTGPKRDGEMSIAEAMALKCVTNATVRRAIYTHRLSARWDPSGTRFLTAVPPSGNNNQGRWYIKRADLQEWHPARRHYGGGALSRPKMVTSDDEMTPSEVAALKGITSSSVREAIHQGHLPARWIPSKRTEEYRLPTNRRPGRWLIQRSDAEAYARAPKSVPPPRRGSG